jgi:hypothetical protein
MVKKSMLFTIDALIASIIIFSSMLIISNLYIYEKDSEHLSLLSNDILEVMSEMKIGEINNSYVKSLIEDCTIKDKNNTIIAQIGEFWALEQPDIAENILKNITEGLFPQNFGFSFDIGDEEVYSRDFSSRKNLISTRRMISGYEKSKPVKGTTARAHLMDIDKKRFSSFAYFGGFVGQGNISRQLEFIPSDANISSSFIELDAGTDFDLYINEEFCSSLSPKKGNMSSTRWNISSCNSMFDKSTKNNISIIFTGLLNESYIGGGYVKVNYKTRELYRNTTQGIEYYYLPGIEGLINLYSAMNIPGTLNSIDIYLHFYNNKTTSLIIGNETVFNSSGSSVDQIVNISDRTLPLEPATIPIRLASSNISEINNVTSGEPSASVLVTDVSGSMNYCAEYTTVQYCEYDCCRRSWGSDCRSIRSCPYTGSCSSTECGACPWHRPYEFYHEVVDQHECLNTKMDLAKEADLEFVDTVLNLSGNRIGLISYEGGVRDIEPITEIKINLESEINNYYPSGGTCICCGINNAKDLLEADPYRGFMVVMSDGQPTYYCNGFSDYQGSGNWGGDSTGGSSSAQDKQWSIDAGQNACDLGIIVFSVGFGTDADHETLKQIACNESLYYNASDASNITEIYKEIGEQIKVIANYSSQVITISGEAQKSILYPDSYIMFNYTPLVIPPSFREIEVIIETDKFDSCSNTVNIPNSLRIVDAKVISYSGQHWTNELTVNNQNIFNLTDYGTEFRKIGDPFVVQVPVSYMQNGDNTINLQTADNPVNMTGCSKNNSMIYTAAVKSSVPYKGVLPNAEGCNWKIETEDSKIINATVPSSYSGTKICSYNSTIKEYDDEDGIDQAVFDLLTNLDFDNNGKINIDIEEDNLRIEALWVSQVPYLWGPAVVEVRV